jgi:hypothetical protein
MPLLNLLVNLSGAYPSKQGPKFQIVDSPFYKICDNQIIQGLEERWAEGNPCLYDCVCFIQDELFQTVSMPKTI